MWDPSVKKETFTELKLSSDVHCTAESSRNQYEQRLKPSEHANVNVAFVEGDTAAGDWPMDDDGEVLSSTHCTSAGEGSWNPDSSVQATANVYSPSGHPSKVMLRVPFWELPEKATGIVILY